VSAQRYGALRRGCAISPSSPTRDPWQKPPSPQLAARYSKEARKPKPLHQEMVIGAVAEPIWLCRLMPLEGPRKGTLCSRCDCGDRWLGISCLPRGNDPMRLYTAVPPPGWTSSPSGASLRSIAKQISWASRQAKPRLQWKKERENGSSEKPHAATGHRTVRWRSFLQTGRRFNNLRAPVEQPQ
jgi:hypothetical protein